MTHTHVATYPLTPSVRDRFSVVDPASPPGIVRLLRFAAVMAALLTAAAFPQSSFFTISEITIAGTRSVSAADILARSGLRVGQRLATIDAGDVVNRLTQHPWIAAARLNVSPAGRVIISIQERVPHAALPRRDAYLLLDHAGVALAVVRSTPSVPVITVEGVTLPWVRIGDRIPSASALDAVRVLGALPAQEVARGLRLRVDRSGSIMLTTADGITVLLGQPRGLPGRITALPQVLSAIRRQRLGVQYVDLRFTGSVIIKPGTAPAGATPAGGGVRH